MLHYYYHTYMNLEEKIDLIDNVLPKLRERIGEVTEFLGRPRSPDEDSKFRVLENEIIELGMAKKIGGGDNSTTGGFITLEILPKGDSDHQVFYWIGIKCSL